MNKKLLIGIFLVGVLLVGSLLVLYNQKPENVSVSEFLSDKLDGLTGFVIITADDSADWNGTFVNTTITGNDYDWLDYNINSFINADNLMLSIDNKILT